MQPRQRYIVANWKMNGDYALAMETLAALRAAGPFQRAVPVICPPFTLLSAFADLRGVGELGAQDCSIMEKGARTGDISAPMLAEQRCKFVIVGHSERRRHHAETPACIVEKTGQARAAGLKPIICVGENLEERQAGRSETIVRTEVLDSLSVYDDKKDEELFILYEPSWAISSVAGAAPATPQEIAVMHDFIKKLTAESGFHNVHILYGGSVNAMNARDILALPNVDGVLVGAASLQPQQFIAIAKEAESLP